MNIIVKENAIQKLIQHTQDTGKFLRVVVTEGGCSGMTYSAEIAEGMNADEKVVFLADEVQIVSDQKSMPYLDGLVIDYSDDLISGGLKFSNDKTQNTCGCGSSFSLAGFPVKSDGNCSK